MQEIRLKAYAKINITLDVLRKREDGYHDVQMIMQTVDLHDKLKLKKTKKNNIELNTNLKWLPKDEKNLAFKAAKLMKEKFNIQEGIRIDLKKVIPVSAGLAGGSTDAAAVIIGMNKLFNIGLNQDELLIIGKEIGADVPFCIMGGTALAEGIGEKLTSLEAMPKCYFVLAKPDIRVSTPWVYGRLNLNEVKEHPNTQNAIEALRSKDIITLSKEMKNVLETVTIKEYPKIQELKHFLNKKGAVGVLMSGSGPTVFGVFDKKQLAKKAVYEMKQKNIVKNVYFTSVQHSSKGF